MAFLVFLFLFSLAAADEYIVKVKNQSCILNIPVKKQIDDEFYLIDVDPVELNNLPLTCIEVIEENKKVKTQGDIGWAVENINAYISFQLNNQIIAVIDSGLNEDNTYQIIEPYNAIDDSNDVSDKSRHGTTVSKIIASVIYNPQIIPCKFIDENTGSLFDEIKCYEYLIKKKEEGYNISVINGSYSSMSDSYLRRKEIEKLQENGVMLVAAAGNNGVNLDETKNSYPCLYTNEFDNVICVGASTKTNNLYDFSNYGKNSVDITAPGYAFGYYGTSISAPFITSAVAVVKNINPDKHLKEIKQMITSSVNPSVYLENTTKSGGVIDFVRLLNISVLSAYTQFTILTDTDITFQYGSCNTDKCSFKVPVFSTLKLEASQPVEWKGDCDYCGISTICTVEIDRSMVCYANSLEKEQVVYEAGGCSLGKQNSLNELIIFIFVIFLKKSLEKYKRRNYIKNI